MSNTDFVLAVEDLTVSFDGFKAIDNLTLYVDKNELRVHPLTPHPSRELRAAGRAAPPAVGAPFTPGEHAGAARC